VKSSVGDPRAESFYQSLRLVVRLDYTVVPIALWHWTDSETIGRSTIRMMRWLGVFRYKRRLLNDVETKMILQI